MNEVGVRISLNAAFTCIVAITSVRKHFFHEHHIRVVISPV